MEGQRRGKLGYFVPSNASAEIRYRQNFVVGAPDECWPWTKGVFKDRGGHGQFHPTSYTTVPAHRFGWELIFGPIPPKLCVCHSCDNPPCQNPAHWFLGTRGDNVKDMTDKGRGPKGVKNAQAKLTETQVKEIRASLKTNQILAKKYGVSAGLISQIQTRKIWKHI